MRSPHDRLARICRPGQRCCSSERHECPPRLRKSAAERWTVSECVWRLSVFTCSTAYTYGLRFETFSCRASLSVAGGKADLVPLVCVHRLAFYKRRRILCRDDADGRPFLLLVEHQRVFLVHRSCSRCLDPALSVSSALTDDVGPSRDMAADRKST